MKKVIDSEKIVSDFENYCLQYDAAEKAFDHKVANKYAKKMINCYLKLKEIGRIESLEKLLYSENENVRLWSATHVLKVNEDLAKKVLQELAAKSNLLGFSAETTLNEWEKGALTLEYDNYKVKW